MERYWDGVGWTEHARAIGTETAADSYARFVINEAHIALTSSFGGEPTVSTGVATLEVTAPAPSEVAYPQSFLQAV